MKSTIVTLVGLCGGLLAGAGPAAAKDTSNSVAREQQCQKAKDRVLASRTKWGNEKCDNLVKVLPVFITKPGFKALEGNETQEVKGAKEVKDAQDAQDAKERASRVKICEAIEADKRNAEDTIAATCSTFQLNSKPKSLGSPPTYIVDEKKEDWTDIRMPIYKPGVAPQGKKAQPVKALPQNKK